MTNTTATDSTLSLVERIGKKIPDPVIIFMFLLVFCFALTSLSGGLAFDTRNPGGGVATHVIKDMSDT